MTTPDIMALRLEMAAAGWDSEDRLTTMGWRDGHGYSIWFRRADWHGKRTLPMTGNFAIYHAHTSDPGNALETARKAAALARKAWDEFPDVPPEQGIHGVLTPGRVVSR